ncbi:ELWxxDGT repeat protein [Jiulongibacter sediminis]|uniref:ELWxxDGT repeat-containing protein n=1 Tax=Jiulongibacter sediminis TaxID=1605367 RepID=A0A0P7C054_9BACT|nr:ELWxxDGT repeat protein [Jiulongibacter sediminis]KPM47921.1 hypothetical protein AFM12_11880 [Jiulongibacter sediminis]TBX24104.1 hypothetical protein TK44_11890 [Jiulongibacter sediminis]
MKKLLILLLFAYGVNAQQLLKQIGNGTGNTYYRNHENFNNPITGDSLILIRENDLFVTDLLSSVKFITPSDTTVRNLHGGSGSTSLGKFSKAFRLGDNMVYYSSSGNTQMLGSVPLNGTTPILVYQKSDGNPMKNFTVFDGKLLFTEYNSTFCNCYRLMSCDGNYGGCTEIKQFGPNPPENLTIFNNEIFFSQNDDINGLELWKTDGTAGGTVIVKDILPGSEGSYPSNFLSANGKLYFSAVAAKNTTHTFRAIFETDGTSSGTQLIYPQPYTNGGFYPQQLQLLGDDLYFGNLTSYGKVNLLNQSYLPLISSQMGLNSSFILNGKVYQIFSIENPPFQNRFELWESDGTVANTKLVKELSSNAHSAEAKIWINNSRAYIELITTYNYSEGEREVDIWTTDGTTAGTLKLDEIDPSISTKNNKGGLGLTGNTFFFNAYKEGLGYELLKTDGSQINLVEDFNEALFKPEPSDFFSYDDQTFFMASNNKDGRELWKTDGTSAGTIQLFDWTKYDKATPNGNSAHNTINDFAIIGDNLIYMHPLASKIKAYNMVSENITDLKSLSHLYTESTGKIEKWFTKAATGKVIFVEDQHPFGKEPWVTDGTPAGTMLLKDINAGNSSSSPHALRSLKSKAVFVTESPRAFWITDGTASGTLQVGILPATSSLRTNIDSKDGYEAYVRGDTAFYNVFNNSTGNDEVYAVNQSGVQILGSSKRIDHYVGIAELSDGLFFKNGATSAPNTFSKISPQGSFTNIGGYGNDTSIDHIFGFRDSLFFQAKNLNTNLKRLYKSKGNFITTDTLLSFNYLYSDDIRYVPIDSSTIVVSALYYGLESGNEIWLYQDNQPKKLIFKAPQSPVYPYSAFENYHLNGRKLYFTMGTNDIGTQLWVMDFTCPDNITINQVQHQNGTFQSGNSIDLESQLVSPVKTSLEASNKINLNPGTQIEAGAVFKAEIRDCPY